MRSRAIILWYLVLLLGCTDRFVPVEEGLPRPQGFVPLSEEPEPAFVEKTTFCWAPPIEVDSARVQVLTDASGSMVGFQEVLPDLLTWVRKAVSQIEGTYIYRSEYRAAQFSSAQGIFNETPWHVPARAVQPRSDTNLHTALHTATDYDLTFLLTDGVAAANVGGDSDCPGGVTAACVGNALRDIMHSAAANSSSSGWGLWMLPLIAPYDGPFYTEEALSIANFDPQLTADEVTEETGAAVSITAPRLDANRRLSFTYTGPRALLLLVLARDADIGRAAVLGLHRNVATSGIDVLSSFASLPAARQRISTLAPIEVYPGAIDPVAFSAIIPEDISFKGSIDKPTLQAAATNYIIPLSCIPPTGADAAVGHFRLLPRPPRAHAGCVDFRVLPAFITHLETPGTMREAVVDLIPGYYPQGDTLGLVLSCSPAALPSCSGEPLLTQFTSSVAYEPAARCLETPSCQNLSFQNVHTLATSTPSRQPHRIYGFADLLREFYINVNADNRQQRLAQFSFCKQ